MYYIYFDSYVVKIAQFHNMMTWNHHDDVHLEQSHR